MRRLSRFLYLAALGGIAVTRCGEPLAPAANRWVLKATFPGGTIAKSTGVYFDVEDMAVTPAAVYFAVTRFNAEVRDLAVISYTGGYFKEEWTYTDAGHESRMCGIGNAGSTIWAGGVRFIAEEKNTYVPVLIRKYKGDWQELDLGPDPGFEQIISVYPVSPAACWLLTWGRETGYGYDLLVKYENGVCRSFPRFSRITAAYDVDSDTFLAIHDKEANVVTTSITTDGGITWVDEKSTLTALSGANVSTGFIREPVVCGGDLYFVLGAEYPASWKAIYRRSGPAGAGVYEMVFYSNLGPYFRDVKLTAADESARFMAVGPDTCVIYDGQNWLLEKEPYTITSFNALASGGNGFYAVANNGDVFNQTLLYHP